MSQKGMNKKLNLPTSKMKEVIIAFDVDGTLLNNSDIEIYGEIYDPHGANTGIVTLVLLLSKMKNTKLICWSGGGGDYARSMARSLHLEKYFKGFYHKANCPYEVDIAIDDIQDTALGKINLIVREK